MEKNKISIFYKIFIRYIKLKGSYTYYRDHPISSTNPLLYISDDRIDIDDRSLWLRMIRDRLMSEILKISVDVLSHSKLIRTNKLKKYLAIIESQYNIDIDNGSINVNPLRWVMGLYGETEIAYTFLAIKLGLILEISYYDYGIYKLSCEKIL